MKKIMVFAAVFLIMLFSATAESGFVPVLGETLQEVEGQALPGPLATLFGNEQINFHIQLENGEEAVIGLVTENKVVKSVSSSGVAKPTLNVYTSEAVIKEITSSASPPAALLTALKEEKITYKAVGFFNKIKFAFLSVFSNIAALFVSEEAEAVAESAADNAPVQETAAAESGAVAGAGQTAADTATGATGGSAGTGTAAGAGGTAADATAGTAGGSEGNAVDTAAGTAGESTGTGATAGAEGTAASTQGTAADTTADSQITTGAVADVPTGETYTVEMTNEGFSKSLLTINAGDTVVWKNVRTGSVLNKAMIIGVRDCRMVKSNFFLPGESFSWTFKKPGECVIVDGIMTTQSSKIIIEQ